MSIGDRQARPFDPAPTGKIPICKFNPSNRADEDGEFDADGAGTTAHSVTDTLCAVRDAAVADVKWAAGQGPSACAGAGDGVNM